MLNEARDLIDRARQAKERRTGPLILELDLTEDVLEAPPRDAVSMALTRRRLTLRGVHEALRRAAADPRVRALIAKVGVTGMNLARVQELRAAVATFRESGKPAVAWAETLGEFGPGTRPYYLATAFDEIWLQPSGGVGLTGATSQMIFLRGALDRLGVEPQFGTRHEYKNAVDGLMRHEFSPAHREAIGQVISSAMEQVVAGIAEARELAPEAVRAAIDSGPVPSVRARDTGLVDRIGYRDEVYRAVRDRVGADARLLFLSRYRRAGAMTLARRVQQPAKPVVGLIYATGTIRQGRSGRGAFGPSLGSDTITAAIRAAARDEKVRAIVLRVDSPGGSYVASDTVWREVVQARRGGTPVVVSMGDLAASGGYFISMAADAIVAQPGTITGSIGVIGGKAVFDGLLDRLGANHQAVSEGTHAELFSTLRPYSDDDWALVNAWLDRVYDDFTAKVAEGRSLSRERVHELARGRVWTGADAAERGLVDELGGFERAVELASQKAGLGVDPEVRVVPRQSPLDRLVPAQSSEDPTAVAQLGLGAAAGMALEAWGPVAHIATRLGLPAAGPLTLPPEYRLRW